MEWDQTDQDLLRLHTISHDNPSSILSSVRNKRPSSLRQKSSEKCFLWVTTQKLWSRGACTTSWKQNSVRVSHMLLVSLMKITDSKRSWLDAEAWHHAARSDHWRKAWRLSVVMNTACWRHQYREMATKDGSRCGAELEWAFETQYGCCGCQNLASGIAQAHWNPKGCESQIIGTELFTLLEFCFDLILTTPWPFPFEIRKYKSSFGFTGTHT